MEDDGEGQTLAELRGTTKRGPRRMAADSNVETAFMWSASFSLFTCMTPENEKNSRLPVVDRNRLRRRCVRGACCAVCDADGDFLNRRNLRGAAFFRARPR